jgi:hypothetical protein
MTNVGSIDDPSIEIEVYPGGTGVIRTTWGWYPVRNFEIAASAVRFQVDGIHEVPGNSVDQEILQRAAAILNSDAVWNRVDNRQCPASARTWSIYYAAEQATIDVTGAFHHRRPALELVREIVDERAPYLELKIRCIIWTAVLSGASAEVPVGTGG